MKDTKARLAIAYVFKSLGGSVEWEQGFPVAACPSEKADRHLLDYLTVRVDALERALANLKHDQLPSCSACGQKVEK
jgi:hypothetical protein